MENSLPAYTGEVQHWQGYWMQDSSVEDMQIELFQASDDRVYGYGWDCLGLFTWKGSCEQGEVLLAKKYLHQHALQYIGRKSMRSTMEGEWYIGGLRGERFYFERLITSSVRMPVTAYLQEWQGHRIAEGAVGETHADLVFTSEGKVYGGGTDDLGGFTILGNYYHKNELTKVGVIKQYDDGEMVSCDGMIYKKEAKLSMEGTWTSEDSGEQNTFCLTTWNVLLDIEGDL